MKSIRETAEEIARTWIAEWDGDNDPLVAAIEQALRDERERCAKIAEAMRPPGGRLWTDEQLACFDALSDCAKSIRNGVEP